MTHIRPVISKHSILSGCDNSSMSSTMTPWLHFTGGDNLYFKSWRPASSGAIAGACIALVCLALLERFMAVSRSVMEARWRHRTLILTATSKRESNSTPSEINLQHYERGDATQLPQQPLSPYPGRLPNSRRLIAPFILAHDIPRGGMYAMQALLSYVLMLAVMCVVPFYSLHQMFKVRRLLRRTFQAAYLISIILGLAIGEVLFRRMESVVPHAP